MGPYLVGHSSVSRRTRFVSRSPPMSAHATSDFCSVTARSECGTKSTCALAKSAGVSVV